MNKLVAMAFALLLAGCQSLVPETADNTKTLRADLVGTTQKQNMGTVVFSEFGGQVTIKGAVLGLNPKQTYAIHIHENGNCGDKGKASGGHFNPHNNPHGHPDSKNSHAGDLPNITASDQGVAVVDYTTGKITTQSGKPSSIGGRAVIVHAGADDYVSQPSGDSGERIACGVIR